MYSEINGEQNLKVRKIKINLWRTKQAELENERKNK